MPKNARVLALFDVDGTLTEPRKVVSPETVAFIAALREKIAIGVVGGSDLVKQKEQLGDSPAMFDWCFAENGLWAAKDGAIIGQTSFKDHLGEEKLKKLINWILRYFSDLDIPVKRGTFVEFRQGMLNVSPIGRNCSREERNEFEKFDLANKVCPYAARPRPLCTLRARRPPCTCHATPRQVRETMVAKLREEFADYELTYSIGGQISFDVFPQGWDKTFCLKYLPEADFDGAAAATPPPHRRHAATAAAAAARRSPPAVPATRVPSTHASTRQPTRRDPLLWRQDLRGRQRLRDLRAPAHGRPRHRGRRPAHHPQEAERALWHRVPRLLDAAQLALSARPLLVLVRTCGVNVHLYIARSGSAGSHP